MHVHEMNTEYLEQLKKYACTLYDWKMSSYAGVGRSSISTLSQNFLINFQQRLGITGSQSSGKTTLVNVLLGFPYLPTAQVVITNCVTEIVFGEELEIQ